VKRLLIQFQVIFGDFKQVLRCEMQEWLKRQQYNQAGGLAAAGEKLWNPDGGNCPILEPPKESENKAGRAHAGYGKCYKMHLSKMGRITGTGANDGPFQEHHSFLAFGLPPPSGAGFDGVA